VILPEVRSIENGSLSGNSQLVGLELPEIDEEQRTEGSR